MLPMGPLRAVLLLLLLLNTLVVVALVGALNHYRPTDRPTVRLPWLVLLAVQLCSVTAFVFWYLIPSITGGVLPVPSPVDGPFLTLYAGNCVAVGTLSMRQRHQRDRKTLLDVLMVTASLGALLWVFLIQSYVQDADLSTATKLMSVAYPGLDLVLVVLTLRLAFAGGRNTPAKALLLCWASLQLAGDTAYGVLALRGEWTLASPVILLWMTAFGFLAAAALHPTMADLARWIRQDGAPHVSEDGPANHEPILDEAVIAELACLGDEVMGSLVPVFMLDTEAQLDNVRTAVRDGDVEGLTGAAHALRGSAGNMGGVRVATMCRRLEDAARNGHLDQAPTDLLGLEAEVVQMLAAVATHTQSPA